MTKITLAGTQPNDPVLTNMFMFQRKMHKNTYNHLSGNERLSVNDCFLRNMQKYKYIANIDNDEVIVPQNVSTWSEMMKLVKKQAKNKVTLDLCLVISILWICIFVDSASRLVGVQNGLLSGYYAYNRKPIQDTFIPSHDATCVSQQTL